MFLYNFPEGSTSGPVFGICLAYTESRCGSGFPTIPCGVFITQAKGLTKTDDTFFCGSVEVHEQLRREFVPF